MITGTTIAYKVTEHDYCLAECIASLLPVCDEIIVVDCSPDDETSYAIRKANLWDKKIRIILADWKPSSQGAWLADIVNYARSKANPDSYHIHLQADEVIHESSYPEIRERAKNMECVAVHRYNFWKDHRHLCPHGTVCGHRIPRCAPMSVPCWGDGETLQCPNPIRSSIEFFHYGFIREIKAFSLKARMMEMAYVNQINPVWDRVDVEGAGPIRNYYPDGDLILFNGQHPAVALAWLKDHGYE